MNYRNGWKRTLGLQLFLLRENGRGPINPVSIGGQLVGMQEADRHVGPKVPRWNGLCKSPAA